MPASGLVGERLVLINLLRINTGVKAISVLEKIQDRIPESWLNIQTVERTINMILELVQVPSWFHETLAQTRDSHFSEFVSESQYTYPLFNTRKEAARVWTKICIDKVSGVVYQPPPCFKTIVVVQGTQMEGWVLSSLSIDLYLDELAAAESWELEIWNSFIAQPDVQELTSMSGDFGSITDPDLTPKSFEREAGTGTSLSTDLGSMIDPDLAPNSFEREAGIKGSLSTELGSMIDLELTLSNSLASEGGTGRSLSTELGSMIDLDLTLNNSLASEGGTGGSLSTDLDSMIDLELTLNNSLASEGGTGGSLSTDLGSFFNGDFVLSDSERLTPELGSMWDIALWPEDAVASSQLARSLGTSMGGTRRRSSKKRKLENEADLQRASKRKFSVETVGKLIEMIQTGHAIYKALLQRLTSGRANGRIRPKEMSHWYQLLRPMVQPAWFHAAIENYRNGNGSASSYSALIQELKLIGGKCFTTESVKYIETWVSLCIEPLEQWATTRRGKRPCHPCGNGAQPKIWFMLSEAKMIEYLESLIR